MPMMTDKYDAKESKTTLKMLSKMYSKTLLDGNFQRWGGISRGSGWTVKNGRSFIENFIQGKTWNNVINVDVESSLKYAKEIKDTKSIAYFQDVQSRGYQYVSIDGNNTASYLTAFIQDHKDLKITHIDYSNKIRFSDLTEGDQDDIKHVDKINVVLLRRITLDEMCELFRNLNKQTNLNAQEWRQARWSQLSQNIRSYGESSKDFFTHVLYTNIQDLDKRSHEELIAAMALKLEKGHEISNTHKTALDSFYENSEYLSSKTISALDNIFKVCDGICSSLPAALKTKLKKGQVQNLFEFIHVLTVENNYTVASSGYRQIFDWFMEKDKAFTDSAGSVPVKDQAEKSYIYWSKNWTAKTSWINVRNLFAESLKEEAEDLINKGIIKKRRTSKDQFKFADKLILRDLQGNQTRSGDSITITDLYLGKYEADHVVPVSAGGETIIENAELMTIEENRKKGANSNKPYFDFQHPAA
jgi:hypothetical protein